MGPQSTTCVRCGSDAAVALSDGLCPRCVVGDLLGGARKGPYELIRRLGEGAMGEVWQARDTRLDRTVALKILKGHDPHELARFRREAMLAAKLSHPNIAAVFEAGDDFIAMQFIDGATLGPGPDAVRHVRDAARAIAYAHDQGVIHRDLKPENLMVDKSGRVYVTDFGLARGTKTDSSLSMSGMLMGTPAYMSPEQARGRKADERSDVFGLGAVLYFLLTGNPPNTGQDMYEVVRCAIEVEPKPPACDRDLRTIVMKCLEKEPSRRYATASALADDLTRHLNGESILARPAGVLYRFKRSVTRNPALSSAVAAAVLIALAAGIFFVFQRARRAGERAEQALQLREQVLARERLREASELCRQALEHVKEAEALWRMKTSRREQWELHFDQALEKVGRAIQLEPTLAGSHYTRGAILETQGRWRAAIECLDRALGLDSRLSNAYARRGRCHLELYRETVHATRTKEAVEARAARAAPVKRKAIADLKKYSQIPGGEDLELRYAEAAVAYAEGRLDEAARTCEALLEKVQTDERVWLLRAEIQMDRHRHQDAIETLTRLIEDVAPRHPRAHFFRGVTCYSCGRYAEAIRDYTQVIELEPTHVLAFLNRGAARFAVRDYAAAVNDATKVIGLDSTFDTAYDNRGAARLELGDPRGALQDFTRATELDPRHPHAFVNRAVARTLIRDYQGAVEDCTRAIDLDSKSARAYGARASARVELGDHEAAARDATQAIRLEPGDIKAYETRGVARLRLLDWAGAIHDSNAALALDPKCSKAYLTRGLAKHMLEDSQGAFQDMTTAIRLDPGAAPAYLNRGVLRLNWRDYAGAAEDCTCAIALEPGLAQAHGARGVARFFLGDVWGALFDLRRATALDPSLLSFTGKYIKGCEEKIRGK